MRQEDRVILDRLHALSGTLSQRAMLLGLARDDVNVFAEGLRDLGHDLTDAGQAALVRVAEIDAVDGVPLGQETHRSAAISGILAELASRLEREISGNATTSR